MMQSLDLEPSLSQVLSCLFAEPPASSPLSPSVLFRPGPIRQSMSTFSVHSFASKQSGASRLSVSSSLSNMKESLVGRTKIAIHNIKTGVSVKEGASHSTETGEYRYSPPPSVTLDSAAKERIDAIMRLFGISEQLEIDIKTDLFLWNSSREFVVMDWMILQHLLHTDKSILSPADFRTQSEYINYKQEEASALSALLSSLPYKYPRSPTITLRRGIFSICVQSAQSLYRKDVSGSSHPYVLLWIDDIPFFSQVQQSTVNPTWNFALFALLTESSKVVLTVWNRRSDSPDRSKDSFLGQIELSRALIASLFENGGHRSKYQFDLQKRPLSKRITGFINLVISKYDESIGNNGQFPLNTIPLCPQSSFITLIKRCLESGYCEQDRGSPASSESTLGERYSSLINQTCRTWRLPVSTSSASCFHLLATSFSEGKATLAELRREFELASKELENRMHVMSIFDEQLYRSTCQRLRHVLHDQLVKFFCQLPSFQRNDLEHIIDCLIYIDRFLADGPVETSSQPLCEPIDEAIVNAIDKHCYGLRALAFDQRTGPIESLGHFVELLGKELEVYLQYFGHLIANALDVPLLASKVFVPVVSSDLLRITAGGAIASTDMSQVYSLYQSILKFRELVGRLYPGPLDEILQTSQCFRPFIIHYINDARRKTQQWAMNAIEQDSFTPMNSNSDSMFSTSVIDVVEFCDKYIRFIQELHWPDPHEEAQFLSRMVEIVSETLEAYCSLIHDRFKLDLGRPGTVIDNATLPQPRQNKLAKFIKVKANKSVPVEMRITSEACVKLSNVFELESRIHELFSPIESVSLSVDPARSAGSLDGHNKLPTRFLLRITLLHAARTPVHTPLSTLVFVRFVTLSGRELARSSCSPQGPGYPTWNDELTLILPGPRMDAIEVHLMHQFLDGRDLLVGRARLGLDLGWNTESETWVAFGDEGEVLMRISSMTDRDEISFFRSRLDRCVKCYQDRFIAAIVGRLCGDLRVLFKASAERHKTQPLKIIVGDMPSFKELKIGLKRSRPNRCMDEKASWEFAEMVRNDLQPIWAFFEANLSQIQSSCTEVIVMKVVKNIWDQVVIVMESLVVSDKGLDEGGKGKKVWNEGRVIFLKAALQIMQSLFHADGDGLPMLDVDSARFKSLQNIIDHYFDDPESLKAQYQLMLRQSGGDISELDWILKLLKLRKSNRLFVEQELRKAWGRE
ncbi:uncharacterized protein BJ171DRAFT_512729 [Polychytrium aggregatum]|uniref:uncharacterized protein n=1 Tax=Polychytrium aggregatum TaxID=110093 RepID=UPI0022FDB3E7|nr:uncharacterized protein BJ171DRAFT_512729 [Polychytrium aggregatum]KAI9202622.1 hypothetical protein BJ171DRAFT_512729 [Polychytrium aggregatum]